MSNVNTTSACKIAASDAVEQHGQNRKRSRQSERDRAVPRYVASSPAKWQNTSCFVFRRFRVGHAIKPEKNRLAFPPITVIMCYVNIAMRRFENKQMFCRQGCRCEQQYRLHRLLAYDPSNDCRGIFSDWFRFPSCCVCRCYDLPNDLRITSRSPRTDGEDGEDGNSNDLDTWFQNPLNS